MAARKVKLPHNNRLNASNALKTNDIWSITIGGGAGALSSRDLETEEQLLQLAKLAKSAGGENRGTCGKCNQMGHLSFQCRNIQSKPVITKDDFSSSSSSDSDDYDNKASRKRERSKSNERYDDDNDKRDISTSKKHKKEKNKKEKHKKDKHKKEKHKKEKHKKEKKDH